MRKLCCWSAAGLMLLTAAALGAGYARIHPDALLARFAGTAYAAATWCLSAGRVRQAAAEAAPVCQCPKAGPIVFSDLEDPQALRARLSQLHQELAADVGDIEPSEPAHGVMPLLDEDDPATPDLLPPSARDTALPAEKDLAQMWLQLLGKSTKSQKKSKQPAPSVGQGDPEESELSNAGRPAKCQEDPAYDLHYPGCPYAGPQPGMRRLSPLAPPRMSPLQDSKGRPSVRYFMPDPSGAHEEVPVHPEVDTMEFRPSDAQEGEFDPHPL